MNPLAYFALELTYQREQEAERIIRLRRQRVADDDAPLAVRDRRWAQAIRRFANGGNGANGAAEAASTEPQPQSPSQPSSQSRPVGQPLGNPLA